MSWEWSHTSEALENARDNVFGLPREDLIIIWAEIRASKPDSQGYYSSDSDFNLRTYEKLCKAADRFPDDILASDIWDFMEEYRTCDNGGFNAYCCPFGCHTVPFGKEAE